ncbi:hypothetical protein [Cellulomonas timonensis]|uniref:hypothetical protein n=1 Tax=Cellulomonas timonensis TaxID=1689271 RepID=UPI00083582E0|nr:hypothetical protein [Cellulomonas timonensis]
MILRWDAMRRSRLGRALTGARAREVALVAAVLVVLELLMFWHYFTGNVVPAPDDFIGSYNNEPLAWWRDGSLLSPAQWMPYSWGGFPAAISIQNGSWYLPIGIFAAITPYSIHAAAALQALHVAFGALGVYVLGRRWGLARSATMFGLVTYFFAASFYTNALHPDIVRGAAWAPWVIAVLSPTWAWKRWWGIPVAAVVIWQALAGSYPGVIVAGAYCGIAWVVTAQIVRRPRIRDFLLPLCVAGLGALLLSAPKYLTAIGLRGTGSPTGVDESIFDWRMVGTTIFPYDLVGLPNDPSMRAFFLPAACWAALALVRWRDPLVRVCAVAGGVVLALGMPFMPWYSALEALPGLDLSRFRMADFRVYLLLVVVVAAMAGISRALARARAEEPSRRRWAHPWGSAALLGMVLLALAVAERANYQVARWVEPWTLLAASAAVVALLGGFGRARWHANRGDLRRWVAVLTVLGALSGISWAYAITASWRTERAALETAVWGETSDELIEDGAELELSSTQRPARIALDELPVSAGAVNWNSSFYHRQDAVGGYVNLKGQPAFEAALAALANPDTAEETTALYEAPGLGIEVGADDELPAPSAVEECADSGACGEGLVILPDAYDVGDLSYRVTAASSTSVLFNEAYYPGWSIEACEVGASADNCRVVEPRMGAAGLVLTDLPAGDWIVDLEYATPHQSAAGAAFLTGTVLLMGASVTMVVMARRRRSASDPAEPSDHEMTLDEPVRAV